MTFKAKQPLQLLSAKIYSHSMVSDCLQVDPATAAKIACLRRRCLERRSAPEQEMMCTSCLTAFLLENMPGSLKVRWTVAPLVWLVIDRTPLWVMTRLPLIRPLMLEVPCHVSSTSASHDRHITMRRPADDDDLHKAFTDLCACCKRPTLQMHVPALYTEFAVR